MTIQTAAAKLAELGYAILRAETDLVAKTTSYLIESETEKRWATVAEIRKMVA